MFEKDHPSFAKAPDEGATVWRYMDLARYLSLISSSCLHFARADQMTDRWEGAYGALNLVERASLAEHLRVSIDELAPQRRAFALTHIHMNCWHLSEVESAAMWEIYQREGRGVAVRSTWANLTSSIRDDRSIFGAEVSYVNYDDIYITEGMIFDAFLHKRESYAHEREVRLLALTGSEIPDHDNPDEGRFEPEPAVIAVSVDLRQLVTAVHVAPDAPQWIADQIANVTAAYGWEFDVRQSDLAKDPII